VTTATKDEPEPVGAPPEPGQQALFPERTAAACYSRIARWAQQPSAESPEEPLALSHSALETYLKCPMKYKFSYRWRLPGLPTPPMIFGQIMHRSVSEFFRARQRQPGLPLDELQHIYQQQWRERGWPFGDDYQQQEYRASGWQQLQVFHQQVQQQPVTVLELEKAFRWPWEDVLLTGRIDQINRLQGRAVEIVEYKAGEPRPQKKVEKSLQLALYALATQHHLGLHPQRLTLYNFTVNEGVTFSPDENNGKRILETVRDVAARVRADDFPARPGYHCRYCDYQRICPALEQSFTLAATLAAEEQEEEKAEEDVRR
jgi:DNA helicase-2/ATP-dependent DNA helicase PcrA